MGHKYDKKKISLMRDAGKICSSILKEVVSNAKEGVSLIELNTIAESLCRDHNVTPAFKGYEGFPAAICAGVNDVVVHGIPDQYVLSDGDIVSIDFGIKYHDIFSDVSVTVPVGKVSKEADRLIQTVKEATLAGIAAAKPGNRVGDIGNAIQTVAESSGFSVVREMVGHGIGHKLHESPNIPGYGRPGSGSELYRGQTLAIESIINQGGPEIFISSEDGWTSYTNDGMLSALFEHTIVVDDKPEILTAW